MKKNIKVLAVLILLCHSALHLFGQTNTIPFDSIKSIDFGERLKGVESLDQQRQDTITFLISIVDGDAIPDVKDSAAKLLGDYRASEAVNSLVQNLALDIRTRKIKGALTEDYARAVTTALIKIGNPAIPAVIRNLGEVENVRIQKSSLNILYQIDGEKDIVQLRLEKALKAEKDPQKQARLQSALKMLGAMK